MPKAKILCLHGYGTNANFMIKQSASFRKIIEKQAEFIFVDGPFLAPQNFVVDQKVIDLIEGQHRSWLPKVNMEDLPQQFLQQCDKIRVAFEKASDYYDGVMGFSQGAVAIHFMLKLMDEGIIKWKILDNIKFSINLNSNHMRCSMLKNENKQLQIPSFHIISPEDFLYSKSLLHLTQFKNPLLISHSYGHKFPKLGLSESKLLRSFIRKHSGTSEKQKQEFEILSMSNL